MTDPQDWGAVDRYLADRLVGRDPALDAALAASAAADLPPHDVSPLQGRLLELLARLQGARAILELGTLTLPQLTGPFDLVFIDADKRSNPECLEWSLRLTRPGSLIVADNVVRGGAVADTASDDPRLLATALQTVGVKGHDGFALALVTGE